MKQRKWNIIPILLTAAFLLLSAGFCVGRNTLPDGLCALTAHTPITQETAAQENLHREAPHKRRRHRALRTYNFRSI